MAKQRKPNNRVRNEGDGGEPPSGKLTEGTLVLKGDQEQNHPFWGGHGNTTELRLPFLGLV